MLYDGKTCACCGEAPVVHFSFSKIDHRLEGELKVNHFNLCDPCSKLPAHEFFKTLTETIKRRC